MSGDANNPIAASEMSERCRTWLARTVADRPVILNALISKDLFSEKYVFRLRFNTELTELPIRSEIE